MKHLHQHLQDAVGALLVAAALGRTGSLRAAGTLTAGRAHLAGRMLLHAVDRITQIVQRTARLLRRRHARLAHLLLDRVEQDVGHHLAQRVADAAGAGYPADRSTTTTVGHLVLLSR